MAESKQPQRIDYPTPSMATGDLYNYLMRIAVAVNQIPPFSYYSGNPNSGLSANVGTLVTNLASSANTSRLWVKEYGSSNTGWSSLVTV